MPTVKDIWYNGSELITKGRLYNFVVGQRGGGKTFYWKKKCLQDFITKGTQFMWLRRYQTELNEMQGWASALQRQGLFEGHKIVCSKKYIMVDDKIAGYVGTLSRAQHLKSTEYPFVTKIILDEFLITAGSLRYLQDEAETLIDVVETVFRERDKGNIVVCIGNSISVVNPYFQCFGIKPDITKRYTLDPDTCIEMYANSNYTEMKLNTRQGRIAMRTKWGSYAYENKFLNDDYSFIKKRTGKYDYYFGLKYEGKIYGVWSTMINKETELYIDNNYEPNNENLLVVNYDELDEKSRFVKSGFLKQHIMILKIMFNEGKIFFDDLQTKKDFYYIIKAL